MTGQVSAESPQKARFTIKFPRTEQEYDAFLWTEGKNVMAGSFTMSDRTFGFFAVREGTKLAAAGVSRSAESVAEAGECVYGWCRPRSSKPVGGLETGRRWVRFPCTPAIPAIEIDGDNTAIRHQNRCMS